MEGGYGKVLLRNKKEKKQTEQNVLQEYVRII